jgi:transglycosylase-like protein with SLT domain
VRETQRQRPPFAFGSPLRAAAPLPKRSVAALKAPFVTMANPPLPLAPDFASLEVDRFESVPGGRELALLRLEGRYRSRLARPLLEAALLVDDGLAIHRHEPLPDSAVLEPGVGEDDWLWRAAFAVSLAVLEDPETAYVLNAGPGLSVELGKPSAWQPAPPSRARRRGPAAVGRRAAAAAMLVALALAPTTGLADAAGLLGGSSSAEQSVARASHVKLLNLAALCKPGVVHPVQNPRIVCPPSNAPATTPPATKASGSGAKTQTAKGGNGSTGKGGASTDKSGKGSKPGASGPTGGAAHTQRKGHSNGHVTDQHRRPPRHRIHHHHVTSHSAPAPRLRNSNGTPTASNPTFFNALPGPATVKGVPNFVIQQFRVPIFLLPIFQAAGIQYGIRWEVLAAINEIETDYGRNLSVSSAGAVGWMQFMPSTWARYGVDANHDGKRDPYNPVDAIFSAANYLKAAGGDKDIKRAIFAYNHAGWYVDSVLLRAKLLAGVPVDVVGSLTGLTDGRFPVAAHARYADDMADAKALRTVKAGQNAANVIQDNARRHQIAIFANERAPVVAVNDGQIMHVGQSKQLGRFVVLQDAYGNQYTYSSLGSVERYYPVPKANPGPSGNEAQAISAHPAPGSSHPRVVSQPRIFAHPSRPAARAAGGLDQLLDEQAANGGFSGYSSLFTPNLGLNSHNSTLRPLKSGARVIAGTLLGHVGRPDPKAAAHVNFGIRPAGKGAPQIDPKPILDGWKLLESTAIYRANGKNVLTDSSMSIGQILLMSKAELQKRVLEDTRITIYAAGRDAIKTGQVDRRVLAVLEFLAESGLSPTVSSLSSSQDAVTITALNGTPVAGHQDKGGIAAQAVQRLMTLQGTIRPQEIISRLAFGGSSVAMTDHGDRIEVVFHPRFGKNKKAGKETSIILSPGQWSDLIGRLRQIQNPIVPTSPSRYALPIGHGN